MGFKHPSLLTTSTGILHNALIDLTVRFRNFRKICETLPKAQRNKVY